MSVSPAELARKLVHIGFGSLAFLLRDLPWSGAITLAVAAVAFNGLVLPRIGGRALWRGGERASKHSPAIVLYPLSVLGLILAFPGERRWMAAAVWGMLALGDGMAALLGQAVGGPRLPWNARKRWTGSLSFLAFGTLGAAALTAWTLGLPMASALSARTLSVAAPLALVGALVESAPGPLDDNLSVPLAGALALPLLAG
jgi:dolichol kinase